MSIKGVNIDNSHLENGNLPKPSIVVYEKIGVIATTLLIKRITALNANIYQHIVDELIEYIKNP